MGVITVTDIDYGQIFGPFPSHVTPADPAYLIGMLTNDKRPEGIVLKMDPEERREGLRAVDWLPYIQPARDSEEQNMEAYVKEGQVYFRTLRIIRAGEELLVWYSKDFAQLLNIPELSRNLAKEGEQFICPRCGDTFDFPYPLRAHTKFKCSYTLSELSSPNRNSAADTKKTNSDMISAKTAVKPFMISDAAKFRSATDTNKNIMDDGTKDLSKFSKSFPRFIERGTASSPVAMKKRPQCESSPFREVSPPKVPRIVEPKAERLSPPTKEDYSKVSDLNKSPRKTQENRSKDSDVASAFRKVERSLTPEVEGTSTESSPRAEEKMNLSPVSRSISVSLPVSMPMATHLPPRSGAYTKTPCAPNAATGLHGSLPGSIMGLYMPRLVGPALGLPGASASGPLHHVSAHHPAFAAADQIPPGLLEMCRASIPSVGPLTESYANIRNGDSVGAGFPGKPNIFMGGERPMGLGGTAHPAFHYMKSNNPMVEKILQSTSSAFISSPVSALNLSQNWCAKCNATFRMTSDLVYHMRSHHKREFDPMKRKREEKLKCTICNETFRERHHLTRHMSSHA